MATGRVHACASYAAMAMFDPAGLLASTEESLNSIAAEIKQLGEKADDAWQAYQEAGFWKRTPARNFWSAAVRDREAARAV